MLLLCISMLIFYYFLFPYHFIPLGEKMSWKKIPSQPSTTTKAPYTPTMSSKVPFRQPLPRYTHPFNTSLQGLPFNQNTSRLATKLIAELENGHNMPSKLSMDVLLNTVTPATAVSSNHFTELIKNFQGIRKYKFPNMTVIVYDLGLNEKEVKTLKEDLRRQSICNIKKEQFFPWVERVLAAKYCQ